MAIPLVIAFLLACSAGASILPPSSAIACNGCPTSIPSVTTTISQVDGNDVTWAYEWTISPTSLVNLPPIDASECTTAGYVSQYTPGDGCDAVLTQALPVYQDGPLCVYGFTDGLSMTATISLQCNSAATSLQLAPLVPVTQTSDGNILYAFTGSYAGVCQVGPATTTVAPTAQPPQPTPAPTSVGGQCPSSIYAVTTTITQVYNGASTPYEWTISPTAVVNSPPHDANACSVAGYVSQYTPGGSCDAAAYVQTTEPTVNDDGACVYSFNDESSRFITVTLSCNPYANVMNFTSTVPVTESSDAFFWAFTGTYSGVCSDIDDTKKPPKMKSAHAFGRKQSKKN